MTDNTTIEERENGPLIVKNAGRLAYTDGEELAVKPVMALCRCGLSKNKPFCDGSHKDAGFQSRGGRPAGRDRRIVYEGKDLTVTYNPMLCSHAGECGRLAKHIFNPAQKPWVQPDNGSPDDVRAVVAACPSGALALEGQNGAVHVLPDEPGISIERSGPYWVAGVAPPAPLSGEGASADKYVLCRCGKSGLKPFCDGSHRDAGWRDDS